MLVLHNACGRFWPVIRHPLSFGTRSWRYHSREAKRQYWTVGNRPIRKNDLLSLRRISAEAQIQDRSRQKTGLNTAPGFSRVSNKPPLRGAKGTRAQHAGDARNSPPPSFPRTTPSFPRAIRHSRGRGNPVKTKHAAKPPLRGAKGTRAQHAGDARKPPTPPPSQLRTPRQRIHHSPIRHSRKPYVSRGRGNPEKNKARHFHPNPQHPLPQQPSPLPRAITPPPPRGRLRGGHW